MQKTDGICQYEGNALVNGNFRSNYRMQQQSCVGGAIKHITQYQVILCCFCNYSCSVLQDRQALKKIYRTVCHIVFSIYIFGPSPPSLLCKCKMPDWDAYLESTKEWISLMFKKIS